MGWAARQAVDGSWMGLYLAAGLQTRKQ